MGGSGEVRGTLPSSPPPKWRASARAAHYTKIAYRGKGLSTHSAASGLERSKVGKLNKDGFNRNLR
jgi:hypothetical protein